MYSYTIRYLKLDTLQGGLNVKKFVSTLLIVCCLLYYIPVLADETTMTGGELLAMHFIKEFYAEDKGDGEAYFVTFDAANKHFIVRGHYPLLESLIADDPENYQQMVDKLETLFASIDDLIRVCLEEPDAYYMTLSFGLSRLSLESSTGKYLCFSSKGGTVHRVNDEFVTTPQASFYVAYENSNPEDVHALLDFYAAKGVEFSVVEYLPGEDKQNVGYIIRISGEYCDAFEKNYAGKSQDFVNVPYVYLQDAREIAKQLDIGFISITFCNSNGEAFGRFGFHHSSWSGSYFAIDD